MTPPAPSLDIHQLSARYLEEQDRILLRISTHGGTEMRLWLTRRLSLALWPMLNRAVMDQVARQETGSAALHDDASKKMLVEFQRQALLQQADFHTPYAKPDSAPPPPALPHGTEPLLVTEVRITPVATGPLRIRFTEKLSGTKSPRSFQIELAPALVHGLVQLLEGALLQSQWDQAKPLLGIPPAAAASDASPSPERPRYLN